MAENPYEAPKTREPSTVNYRFRWTMLAVIVLLSIAIAFFAWFDPIVYDYFIRPCPIQTLCPARNRVSASWTLAESTRFQQLHAVRQLNRSLTSPSPGPARRSFLTERFDDRKMKKRYSAFFCHQIFLSEKERLATPIQVSIEWESQKHLQSRRL